jgi:hypothetical protein
MAASCGEWGQIVGDNILNGTGGWHEMTKVIVRHNLKASLPRTAMDGKKYKKLHTDRDWKRTCQRICEHNGLEGYAEPKTVCTAFSLFPFPAVNLCSRVL